MYFDLHSLLTNSENLEWLEEPFTKEEIDGIIHNIPSDKSPGPDGFNGVNGDFLKNVDQQSHRISMNSVRDSMMVTSICEV
jgi:hypothetical protein